MHWWMENLVILVTLLVCMRFVLAECSICWFCQKLHEESFQIITIVFFWVIVILATYGIM